MLSTQCGSSSRTRTGDKSRYSCNLCRKSFSLRSVFKRHLRIHTGKKFCACNGCEKSFSEHRGGSVPNPRTHIGGKPYSCDFCNKSFNLRCILKRHVRTHAMEKLYRCGLCSKTFYQRNNFIRHLRTHTVHINEPFYQNIILNHLNQMINK